MNIIKYNKIFYVESSKLGKSARSKWGEYTIVEIDKVLDFGKVKVQTYGFDIPFAYAPVNHISKDIVEQEDIKELNWDAILNDFQKDNSDRKYHIWHFLQTYYPCDSHTMDYFNKDKESFLAVYWDDKEIDRIHYPAEYVVPAWCKRQNVLWEIDVVLDYMIEHNIETENAEKLKKLIRTDEVTMTTEEYLRSKKYI